MLFIRARAPKLQENSLVRRESLRWSRSNCSAASPCYCCAFTSPRYSHCPYRDRIYECTQQSHSVYSGPSATRIDTSGGCPSVAPQLSDWTLRTVILGNSQCAFETEELVNGAVDGEQLQCYGERSAQPLLRVSALQSLILAKLASYHDSSPVKSTASHRRSALALSR